MEFHLEIFNKLNACSQVTKGANHYRFSTSINTKFQVTQPHREEVFTGISAAPLIFLPSQPNMTDFPFL